MPSLFAASPAGAVAASRDASSLDERLSGRAIVLDERRAVGTVASQLEDLARQVNGYAESRLVYPEHGGRSFDLILDDVSLSSGVTNDGGATEASDTGGADDGLGGRREGSGGGAAAEGGGDGAATTEEQLNAALKAIGRLARLVISPACFPLLIFENFTVEG